MGFSRHIIRVAVIAVTVWCIDACSPEEKGVMFPRVVEGRFTVGQNNPYRFIGTNFWYGPILDSQGRGGEHRANRNGMRRGFVHNWFTAVLQPALQDTGAAYAMVGRNANRQRKEEDFYSPYPDHPSEKDFMEFYESERSLFRHGDR